MAEMVTAAIMGEKLAQIQAEVPAVARKIRHDIFRTLVGKAQQNIAGKVMKKTGPNMDLARYAGAAFQQTLADDGETLTAGLPGADEQARILAFRETGGDIFPKNVRNLRIPTDAALTGSGYDRYAGVKLRDLIGKPGNPFRWIPTPHAPKATGALVLKEQWGSFKKIKGARSGASEWKTSKAKWAKKGTVWYWLVRMAHIGEHPWLNWARIGTNEETPKLIETRLAQWREKKGAT